MAKKNKDKKEKSPQKKKKTLGAQLFVIFAILAGVIMMPSTILLAVGMLPTLVIAFVVKRSKRSKVITIGSLNLVGCAPFLFELWMGENVIEQSMSILADPQTVVVMYALAAIGYIVDWALTGVAASFLYQRGLARRDAIERRMGDLVDRWGRKVTGDIPLDQYGFPLSEGDAGLIKEKTETKR